MSVVPGLYDQEVEGLLKSYEATCDKEVVCYIGNIMLHLSGCQSLLWLTQVPTINGKNGTIKIMGPEIPFWFF